MLRAYYTWTKEIRGAAATQPNKFLTLIFNSSSAEVSHFSGVAGSENAQ
jgi:hypothetical protein